MLLVFIAKKLRLDKEMFWEIMKIGIPAGLQGVVFSLSNVVIQSSLNSFNSTTIIAGNSAGANIEGFTYIGMGSFSQATITFTSQNMGAGKRENVAKIMWTTMLLCSLSAIMMSSFVYFLGPQLLSFYTDQAEVIRIGMIRTTYVAAFLVLNGILDVFINSMRGMGYSNMPTLLMLVGICGVRLLWIAFYFPMNQSLESIYYCYPLSWAITSIAEWFLWMYSHRQVCRKNTSLT